MLHIAFVRSGSGKYGPEYVEILYDMIRRNLAYGTKGQFYCLTDQPDELPTGIMKVPTPGFEGWWNKIGLFQPGLFPAGERVWYFDLDMCIVRALDALMAYDGPMMAMRDHWPHDGCLGSTVMTWRAGEMDHVWHAYQMRGCPTNIHGGDQEFIDRCMSSYVDINTEFPGAVADYRTECRLGIPEKALMVNFHGFPKPEDIQEGWVPQVWKVGGGTALEIAADCNTSMHLLKDQIAHAYSLGKPFVPLMNHIQPLGAVMVGGGPSAGDPDVFPFIKLAADNGHTIFALNGAAKWLKGHGIQPTYQVICDARPEMADMILDDDECVLLAATQCNPPVQIAADYLWNANFDGINQFLPEAESAEAADAITVGGGSSVGLLALSLAYVMGYRDFHLFGYDSCFRGDRHHAYRQELNDKDKTVTVDFFGEKFQAAGWMALQVREYGPLVERLIEEGCAITAYGHGLLQRYHTAMMTNANAADLRCHAIISRLNGASPVYGAEIGVSVGALSVNLLTAREDLNLLLVDPYAAGDKSGTWFKSGDTMARRPQSEQDKSFDRARRRVAKVAGGRGHFLRMPSLEAAAYVADGSLDFAFIDADHSYEGCRDDIHAWWPKVKNGGILCGHDYDHPDFPGWGVKQAVDEFAATLGVEADLGDDLTWFIRKQDTRHTAKVT